MLRGDIPLTETIPIRQTLFETSELSTMKPTTKPTVAVVSTSFPTNTISLLPEPTTRPTVVSTSFPTNTISLLTESSAKPTRKPTASADAGTGNIFGKSLKGKSAKGTKASSKATKKQGGKAAKKTDSSISSKATKKTSSKAMGLYALERNWDHTNANGSYSLMIGCRFAIVVGWLC